MILTLRFSAALFGLSLVLAFAPVYFARQTDVTTYFFVRSDDATGTVISAIEGDSPYHMQLPAVDDPLQSTIRWLPDFTLITTQTDDDGVVWLGRLNPQRGTVKPLVDGLAGTSDLALHHVSGDVVFMGWNRDTRLYMLRRLHLSRNADNPPVETLVNFTQRNDRPRWQLHGDDIYYLNRGQTFRVSIDGSNSVQIAGREVWPVAPAHNLYRTRTQPDLVLRCIAGACDTVFEGAVVASLKNDWLLLEAPDRRLFVMHTVSTPLNATRLYCDRVMITNLDAIVADDTVYARAGSEVLQIRPAEQSCTRHRPVQFMIPMAADRDNLYYRNTFAVGGSDIFRYNAVTGESTWLLNPTRAVSRFGIIDAPTGRHFHMHYLNTYWGSVHLRFEAASGNRQGLSPGQPLAFSPLLSDVFLASHLRGYALLLLPASILLLLIPIRRMWSEWSRLM